MKNLAQLLDLAESCKKDVNGLYDNHIQNRVDVDLSEKYFEVLASMEVCEEHGYVSMQDTLREDALCILNALRVYQVPQKFGYTYL